MIKKINIGLMKLIFAMIPFWMLATCLVSYGSLDAKYIDLSFQSISANYIDHLINWSIYVIIGVTVMNLLLCQLSRPLQYYLDDICIFLDFIFDNLIFFVLGSTIFAMTWFVFHSDVAGDLHIFEQVIIESFCYGIMFKALKVFLTKGIPAISESYKRVVSR